MMIYPLRSLRWRLPLSYAGIGLLTALTLGVAVLMILRTYYQQRERSFLEDRAAMIGLILQPLLQDEQNLAALQTQVQGLAFLAQVRVQLLDPDAQIVADSGQPRRRAFFTMPVSKPRLPVSEAVTQTDDILLLTDEFTRASESVTAGDAITSRIMISVNTDISGDNALGDRDYRFVFQAPAPNLFFGAPFNADTDNPEQRSSQQVNQALRDAQGTIIGYVVLNEGPAYGRQIVTSAAWAVLIASLIATLLAALVGWWVSRQLSKPLLELTAVTTQMAAGQLSARAAVTRGDEVGILAHSFNEMAQQVEETVNTLRHFVADAAHELNTPITALRTNLELSPPTPLLQASLEQVMRLETLVKNLLLLSRLEATPAARPDNPAEKATVIDLAQLLHAICEPFASRAEQQEITFTLVITNQAAAPLLVDGNQAELVQALRNLLDNALKFSQVGGAIQVTLHRQGEAILIAVEDTGIGVAPDELPLLFQRFYRARNAAGYPGSGLGLAIVKTIAERHSGSVMAENTGRGMRFILRLPSSVVPL